MPYRGTFSEAPLSFTTGPWLHQVAALCLGFAPCTTKAIHPATSTSELQGLAQHPQAPAWHLLPPFPIFIFLRKHGIQLPRISCHKPKHEMFLHKSEEPLTSLALVRFLSCVAEKANCSRISSNCGLPASISGQFANCSSERSSHPDGRYPYFDSC